MSRYQRWEKNLQDGEKHPAQAGLKPPTLAGHSRRSAGGQSRHPFRVLRRRNDQVPFHGNPPPPLTPVRMRTRPWAPPFPRQTQKGHWRPEHVPTSPQPPGTDAGLQPPAFCCSRCGDMSEAAKVSSLQPPRPQKQQCRIRLLCMSTSSPQASMGRRKEPQGWQISETPWSGERLPCQHTNPHLPNLSAQG